MDSKLGQINLIRWQGGARIRKRGVRPIMIVLFLMAVAGALALVLQLTGRLTLGTGAELAPALLMTPWMLWAIFATLRGTLSWLAG